MWEYRKINLNETPRRSDAIDLLCDAGKEGWELVTVLANNVAYLKRPLSEEHAQQDVENSPPDEVKAKYQDPATGETWSGRGRMATWLKRKQDAGEDIEKYRT
jgi:H-NS histone C-terminal domain